MDKQRVPCFVMLSQNDEVLGSESIMSFFAILDDLEKINEKETVNSSIQPLLLFTGLKSCPEGCSFTSFQDKVYVIGGSTLPLHLQYNYKEHLKGHSFQSLRRRRSNRVLCFEAKKCLDSLFQNNNQMEKVEFGELDEVSNHSVTYWGTRPSLTTGRRQFHIVHLRGKLYAIGGNGDGKRSSLIEVYDQGVWAPLKLDRSSHIDPSFFVSVAIEKDNMILIGSNESFFEIDVGKGSVEKWKGVECPENFVYGCFQQPGFVINMHYALWYDVRYSCIRLLDLITRAHLIVDLPDNIYRLFCEDPEIPCSARLVDLGEGILCLIFLATDLRCAHGVEYTLRHFHYVKFKIIFEGRKAKKSRKSFPEVQAYTRLISHHKFYARNGEMLAAAFAMDVHVP